MSCFAKVIVFRVDRAFAVTFLLVWVFSCLDHPDKPGDDDSFTPGDGVMDLV